LPVVLYGCEILSFTLKEEGVSLFERRMLKRVFAPQRKERLEKIA
jgi:hypothetical protein